jgi:hypothetical protein
MISKSCALPESRYFIPPAARRQRLPVRPGTAKARGRLGIGIGQQDARHFHNLAGTRRVT